MVLALLLCTAADLGSKAWAEQALSIERSQTPPALCQLNEHGRREPQRIRQGAVVLIDGWLELRYAENCGAAFSMLADAPPWLRAVVFYGAATFFVGAILWIHVRGFGGRWFAVSVPLLASGALGNLVDRFRLGYVVDFIRLFHVSGSGAWEYPTFNVADVAIAIGGFLLLLDGVQNQRSATMRSPAVSPDAA
jgi:signal peptidase II